MIIITIIMTDFVVYFEYISYFVLTKIIATFFFYIYSFFFFLVIFFSSTIFYRQYEFVFFFFHLSDEILDIFFQLTQPKWIGGRKELNKCKNNHLFLDIQWSQMSVKFSTMKFIEMFILKHVYTIHQKVN